MADEMAPFDGFKFSPQQLASIQPTYTNHIVEQAKRNMESSLRVIEQAQQEKDNEELRRHEELVGAIRELNDTMKDTVLEAIKIGASVNIDSNTGNINISMNSTNVQQEASQNTELDYGATENTLKEIAEFCDMPKFAKDFGEHAEEIKSLVSDLLNAVQAKEKPGIIKSGLNKLKTLAGGVTGSLLASAIFEGIKHIPGM